MLNDNLVTSYDVKNSSQKELIIPTNSGYQNLSLEDKTDLLFLGAFICGAGALVVNFLLTLLGM